MPTVAYYLHTDQDTRRRAEAAGYDLVVPRSRMNREAVSAGGEAAVALSLAVVTGASSGIGAATARAARRARAGAWSLVARRADRLEQLADELGDGGGRAGRPHRRPRRPGRVREAVEARAASSKLLVNNAGAEWRSTFGEGGYDNVRRTMDVNFDAVVRLTEALLPLLRASAPSVDRERQLRRRPRRRARSNSAYAASKFALAGWSEAVGIEEEPHGVHVGVVLPGFISTGGLPARAACAPSARTRWLVSTPEKVAKAIVARRARAAGARSTCRASTAWCRSCATWCRA